MDEFIGWRAEPVAEEQPCLASVTDQEHRRQYEIDDSHADTFPFAYPFRENAAEDELRDEQAEQCERFLYADAAVRQHHDREGGLRGSEEQLLSLERVERQPARRA